MLSVTLNNLVSDLKPRERDVVAGRFGLNDSGRKTLAEIGGEYGITRERVRQIEAEALARLRERTEKEKIADPIAERLTDYLKSMGGLRRGDLFLSEAKDILEDQKLHQWHLVLLAEFFDDLVYEDSERELHPVWCVGRERLSLAKKFIADLERFVKNKKEELMNLGSFPRYLGQVVSRHGISDSIGMNYVLASRRFAVNPFGDVGLRHWEEIMPRTMGSKAYIVMKKHGKPLHFRDIAGHINRAGFDLRKALPQTIHNELIKDSRFVLVGRGIYALKEHGFTPGTTQEVIRDILKKNGPLPIPIIIESVLARRFLKNNTILLNLQNRKHFKRLPDGRYHLK